MGNPWKDFSLVGIGLRSLNPVGLYPLPSLGSALRREVRTGDNVEEAAVEGCRRST
jgi:hypothetical protein